VTQAADSLSALGHRVELIATTAAGSASIQAREAAERGADIVFACGGDGTIHEVLQGLIKEGATPAATLGILPFGSANALARHLNIPLDPDVAISQLLQGEEHILPIGKINYGDQSRYFIVMAGAGPDGALVYESLARHKASFGRLAYYLHALRLFLTQRFHSFEIAYDDLSSDEKQRQRAVAVMAIRVDDLGGLFGKLVGRQASIYDLHLQLLILAPPAVLSLPLWFALGWLNLHRLNPFLKSVNVSEFSCLPLSGNPSHIQADGEWLSRLPMTVSLIPNAIRILAPSPVEPL
jgi:YegS/Rv2252/BmrU family lipid kinase